ncbi:uncharacterized protein LOC142768768 isoform X6 [Rhipicephalus microplus]|uniref:uncharacterized protein LOC142768768 isoform X6 n=1 Tax=Rhipicephalus microplus TaxID=6941 RepID=UPI003F6AFBBA
MLPSRMWPGSMHDSLIWKDCDLLGSFEGTKLPNGWLQAVGCSRHTCKPSHGALLWCSVQDAAYPSGKTLVSTIMFQQ